jgi:phosphatidylglycerophosphate synthase
MSRLALAALFPFSPEGLWPWLVIAGGLSDVLDGWLARRWQVQSRMGGMLDAVSDKLFILSALATVAAGGRFSLWWIPLILVRDIVVAATAVYAACSRSWAAFDRMVVRWSGKLATAGQFLLLLAALLLPCSLCMMLWTAALLSSVAAGHYGWILRQALRDRKAAPERDV